MIATAPQDADPLHTLTKRRRDIITKRHGIQDMTHGQGDHPPDCQERRQDDKKIKVTTRQGNQRTQNRNTSSVF